MSTIEEAREQARKALARYESQSANSPFHFGLDDCMYIALRALLDATEPPAHDEDCEADWGSEGQESPCRCVMPTDRPAEPMRDADGDMISSGEHRKVSMGGDSFFVCDTCTNVLGLNVRWDHASKREDHQAAVESLPVKPAEDEWGAMANFIDKRLDGDCGYGVGEYLADALIADGYRKGPRPITDEMVEAAAREYHERGNGEGSFARMSGHVRTSLLFRMKCALRAAEEARR